MVFFCCEGCNETLKKNHVEGHTYKCRSCWAVSCVDCSKIFKGDEYKQHTTCISEAEKYQKSLYRGPKGNKKKRNPQEEWMDTITEAASEIQGGGKGPYSQMVKTYVVKMAEMGNVPRNEKKFKNFIKNSLRVYRDQDGEELWRFLEARRAQAAAASEANGDEAPAAEDKGEEDQVEAAPTAGEHKDEEEEPQPKTKKDKKRRKEESEGEEEEKTPNGSSKRKKSKVVEKENVDAASAAAEGEEEDQPVGFDWDKEINKALKKAENKQMPLSALKKQLLGLALASGGDGDDHGLDKKQLKKIFKRKVHAHSRVDIDEATGIVTYAKKKKA